VFGFVIDIYVGFTVRWMIILWRKAASRKWRTVQGTVVRCHFQKCGYGGSYVVIHYKYKFNFDRHHGVLKKPYLYDNYADAFVRHHPADGELKIRVSAKNPKRSFPVLG